MNSVIDTSREKPIDIQVREQTSGDQGKITVLAYPTKFPGLFVHPVITLDKGIPSPKDSSEDEWNVTHAKSGLRVTSMKLSFEQIESFVSKIGDLADWTLNEEELRSNANKTITTSIDQAFREAIGDVYEPSLDDDEAYKEDENCHYYIQRDRDTNRFVIKTLEGTTVTDGDGNPLSFTHRGSAWNTARSMKT